MTPEHIKFIPPPTEVLRQVQEFAQEDLSPETVEFAHLLADRLADTDKIEPEGFILASQLLIYDLSNGVNGFTGEPMDSQLSKRSEEDYKRLFIAVPRLADISTPPSFAYEVKELYKEILASTGFDVNAALFDSPENKASDEIRVSIRTIEDAKRIIVSDAQKRVKELDWAHFGVPEKDVKEIFEASMPVILRNSQQEFQLNTLDAREPEEKRRIDALPTEKKEEFIENFWLVLLNDLNPRDATEIRDWLWLKAPQAIAAAHELDLEEITNYFYHSSESLRHASARVREYIASK